jgi:hypothetical protein
LVLRVAIPLGNPLELTFTDHVDGFITLDGALGGGERPTPSPSLDAAFHKPMVLFQHILQILALPAQAALWAGPLLLQDLKR